MWNGNSNENGNGKENENGKENGNGKESGIGKMNKKGWERERLRELERSGTGKVVKRAILLTFVAADSLCSFLGFFKLNILIYF